MAKIKLNWKITLLYCGLTTLAMSFGCVYLVSRAKSYVENNATANMRRQIFLGKEYLERCLRDSKSLVDYHIIALKMKNTLGVNVAIIRADGKIFGDTEVARDALMRENILGATEVRDALYSGFGVSKSSNSALNKNMLSMAVPFGKDKTLGVLRFSAPLSGMELLYRRLLMAGVIAILMVLVLSLVFGWVVSLEIKDNLKKTQDEKEYFDNVINSVANPLFVKDRKHRWVLLNNAFCEFMGHKRENLIGKSDYDFFPKEEAEVFWIKDEFVFSKGAININEEKFTNAKGLTHTIVTKKVLYKNKRQEEYIVGIISDITELKAKEEKIRKLYQITRDILERSPLGVYVVNRHGRIDYVNSAMLKIAGASEEQFESINVFEISTYKESGLSDKIKDVFLGQYFSAKAISYTTHFSKKTTISNFIGMPFDEGAEKKAIIFVEDITEFKRLEEIKDSFIHMIIHDLNNPLTVLSTELQLLKLDAEKLSSEQNEDLEIAMIAARDLQRMIGNLLDVNRMEEGAIKLRRDMAVLGDTVREVIEQIKVIAHHEQKVLSVEIDDTMPMVPFDQEIIKRVIANLVINALKFTPSQGVVNIKVFYSNEDAAAYTQVKDSGMGIPKEYLEKIFDKFVQVEMKKQRVGRGLGLTFCKMVVEAHGGRIWAESEGANKGATLTFALPLLCDSGVSPGKIMLTGIK